MFYRSGNVCAELWKVANCSWSDWFRQSCPAAENVLTQAGNSIPGTEHNRSSAFVRIVAKGIESDVFPVAVELTGTHKLVVDAIDGDFAIVNQYDSRAFLHS